MTTSYYADRNNWYLLQEAHPTWSYQDLANATGRSRGWVKKWVPLLRNAPPNREGLELVLQGKSRARKQPPPTTHPLVVERVLALRDAPPEGLRRVPGPKAISYYLPRDPLLESWELPCSISPSTIYRILKRNGRIPTRGQRVHEPLSRPEPMSEWQIDFKDISSVPPDPQGKQHQVVEAFHVMDTGTSVLLDAQLRGDFTAATTLQALVETLRRYGCPRGIPLDRDPRTVGSPQGSDFPSPFLRMAGCLGIQMQVCDPHHPQQNAFVERYHRTSQEECLALDRPATLEQAHSVTETVVKHYHEQRPNQALSCRNQAPRTAFPTLPPLAALPPFVDPDSWLDQVHGLHIERKVDRNGFLSVDLHRYYVSKQLKGHRLTLQVDAPSRCLHVYQQAQLLKSLPIFGLVGKILAFEEFLAHMVQQATSRERLRLWQQRNRHLRSKQST